MQYRLAVVCLLWLASGSPAWTGDETAPSAPATLETRATDLAARVETLDATLAELAERIAALEEAFDREEAGQPDAKPKRRPKKPKPAPTSPSEEPKADATPEADSTPEDAEEGTEGAESEPDDGEKEPEDGLDPTIAELIGTYNVDMPLFLEAMTEFIRQQLLTELGDVPPDIIDGAIEAMRGQLESVDFELVLKADMTFLATSTLDGEPTTASGTWAREGDAVKLHQTHEDGEETDEAYDLEGIWDGETLRLQPDEQLPVELVLNKA